MILHMVLILWYSESDVPVVLHTEVGRVIYRLMATFSGHLRSHAVHPGRFSLWLKVVWYDSSVAWRRWEALFIILSSFLSLLLFNTSTKDSSFTHRTEPTFLMRLLSLLAAQLPSPFCSHTLLHRWWCWPPPSDKTSASCFVDILKIWVFWENTGGPDLSSTGPLCYSPVHLIVYMNAQIVVFLNNVQLYSPGAAWVWMGPLLPYDHQFLGLCDVCWIAGDLVHSTPGNCPPYKGQSHWFVHHTKVKATGLWSLSVFFLGDKKRICYRIGINSVFFLVSKPSLFNNQRGIKSVWFVTENIATSSNDGSSLQLWCYHQINTAHQVKKSYFLISWGVCKSYFFCC